jgi:hypothetical protein
VGLAWVNDQQTVRDPLGRSIADGSNPHGTTYIRISCTKPRTPCRKGSGIAMLI